MAAVCKQNSVGALMEPSSLWAGAVSASCWRGRRGASSSLAWVGSVFCKMCGGERVKECSPSPVPCSFNSSLIFTVSLNGSNQLHNHSSHLISHCWSSPVVPQPLCCHALLLLQMSCCPTTASVLTGRSNNTETLFRRKGQLVKDFGTGAALCCALDGTAEPVTAAGMSGHKVCVMSCFRRGTWRPSGGRRTRGSERFGMLWKWWSLVWTTSWRTNSSLSWVKITTPSLSQHSWISYIYSILFTILALNNFTICCL